jgi:DNA polymerase III alpha subunit (gram-positive type)
MIIFDTEADGLLEEATKIHIFGWTEDGEDIKVTTEYDEIRNVLDKYDVVGGHNSIHYDFPLFKKVLGYDYKGLKVDTLAISWYLDPKRVKHSLESYEEEFGLKKVNVEDHEWKSGNLELMRERVVEDVKLNWRLWKYQENILTRLYQ